MTAPNILTLQEPVTKVWSNFLTGYATDEAPSEIPDSGSPYMLDVEVDARDRLVKMPGVPLHSALARTPVDMLVHSTMDFTSSLVFIDPPYIAVRTDVTGPFVDVGLPSGSGWVGTNYAGTLLFTNGREAIYSRDVLTGAVAPTALPRGRVLAVWAGRLWIGAAEIGGTVEPMGLIWSGTGDYDDTDPVSGYGFEALLTDLATSDKIVALKPMGLDLMAILCRRSIWMAQRTGLLFRPANFSPRVSGTGCVAEATAKATQFGLIYLSDTDVELFDGNTSLSISKRINADVFPLDYAQISKYKATYDPINKRYYLHTPTTTWEYDIMYQRWFRRNTSLVYGLPFATQGTALTYANYPGDPSYADMGELTYADMQPEEGQYGVYFLKGANLYQLGNRLDATAVGVAMTPLWHTQESQIELDSLQTYSKVRLQYERGAGTVTIYLPNGDGDLVMLGAANRPLDATAIRKVRRFSAIRTGRGMKMALAFSGDLAFSRAELVGLPRGASLNA